MTYKVIKYFTDLQDNDYAYDVGDIYPRKGKKVTEERLTELSTENNRRNAVFIKPNYSGMKVSELKALAEEYNIEGYDDMKKAELVEAIEGVS